jgi:two-component system cell cycle sensor histidine kinase/response regulator CckA
MMNSVQEKTILNSGTGIDKKICDGEMDPANVRCAVPADAIAGAAFAETGRRGGPEAILLVEDEAFVREVTAEALKSAGYRLVVARSAAEALQAYRVCATSVELLLADVVMPGMSGRELAMEFRSLNPRTRVLLMSGYAPQLALWELSPFSEKYMAKPFSMRMLLRMVRSVLDTNSCDSGAA